MTVRFGITILAELPWREASSRWQRAEELGFDHAWTYDHLVWAGLPESAWFGTMPTLTAAAMVTSRIGIGTFVSSPNFRHPYVLHRDVQSLDDISGGRFLLGVGTGGDLDSRILGGEELTVGERVRRFREFTNLLVRLRTEDHVDADGRWFRTNDARTVPPLNQVPLIVAGNGPKSVAFAARVGDAWVTTGGSRGSGIEEWLTGLAASCVVLEEALSESGRDPSTFRRYVSMDAGGVSAMSSPEAFADLSGRLIELGFTDLITHWPRPDAPYAASEATLETIASDVIPALR